MNSSDNDRSSVQPEKDSQEITADAQKAVSDAEPDVVAPVEKADRTPTRRMKAEADSPVDYITRSSTTRRHLRRGEEISLHRGKTKTATPEEIEEAEDGFVFRSLKESDKRRRKEKRRLPRWLKIVIIVVSILLVIAAALVGTYCILREVGRRSMHNYDNIDIVPPTSQASDDEPISVINKGRIIVYEGDSYVFNENVVCIGVIGVDEDVTNEYVQSMGDAINLVALDTSTGKLSVIAVSRDTMTDVSLYSAEGRYIDTEIMQLAYAYSFGNHDISGGENTTSSLSKLFFGLPVNHYFAINLDALGDLTDAIGGVTLTSSFEFYSQVYQEEIYEGETVTLYGEDARRYVQSRNTEILDSNSSRMQRQQEFIRAFLSQVIPAVKKDLSLVTSLYHVIDSNSDSNFDLPKIVYLASELVSKFRSMSDIDFYSIKGEIVSGDQHAEFYPDDKNIMETMLAVFYQRVS